jgi:20S proteasome alpha/beta subunit
MTLLVALKGEDGLALAADSRGTFGDPRGVTAQNDSQQKAHILAPHVAALQAGSGEVGALIVDEVKRDLAAQGIDGVTPVMNFLRDRCRTNYQNWFPSVAPIVPPQQVISGQAPTRPDLVFIVAGYEMTAAGPGDAKLYQIGALSDFAPMLHDYGFAVAGVAQYALYLLNRLYEPGRSTQELAALAIYVITETASQDGKVGGPVNVVTITPAAGCQALASGEVDEVVAHNEVRSKSLRDSFYERQDERQDS